MDDPKLHMDSRSTNGPRRSYEYDSTSSGSGWEQKPDTFGRKDDSEEDSDDGDGRDESESDISPKKLYTEEKKIKMRLERMRLRNLSLKADPQGTYLVSIDGYYRKNTGENGGYGAILRTEDGLPIKAVAGASLLSVSEFYHTLEGIKAGLHLVKEMGVIFFQISCNSDWVPWILQECFISSIQGKCDLHPRGTHSHHFDTFCVTCLRGTHANKDFTLNFNIMKEIVNMGKPYFRDALLTSFKRSWNRPADFLAKMVRSPGMEKKLAPSEFPPELDLLLSEFDGDLPFILT